MFFSFSAYLIPFWLKIMPRRGFLIFLLFFLKFSCLGRVWTEFEAQIFISLFQPIKFWPKIIPEWGFLIFWIFYRFFSEFSCPGRVKTEFGTKIFFSLFFGLSLLVFVKDNARKGFFKFLNFFDIFFRIFFPELCMNGIRD